jgi:hypothetical protein
MGREATCRARWSGGEGEVKALLETEALILRGAHRAQWRLEALSSIHVEGDWLHLTTPDGDIALDLGPAQAESWRKKLATPPPSLAAKLGVGPAARVQVIGEVEDPLLEEALAAALAPTAAQARLSLAVVADESALDAALAAHAVLPDDAPIWLVNIKGPKSPLGENAVRAIMRRRGFMDSKTASVSATLSATRYARPHQHR